MDEEVAHRDRYPGMDLYAPKTKKAYVAFQWSNSNLGARVLVLESSRSECGRPVTFVVIMTW